MTSSLLRCYRGPDGIATGRTPCGARWASLVWTDEWRETTCRDCRLHGLVSRLHTRARCGDQRAAELVMALVWGLPSSDPDAIA